jgi:hypothetical protein
VTNYGYIDKFKIDGSNTKDNRYVSRGIKAIWNPYIKRRYRYNNTYTDEKGVKQNSPFNYGQSVDIYIIDANEYPLKKEMKLNSSIDVRGRKQTLTVQYSCSNGSGQQNIWRAPMKKGKYYVVLDMNKNGVLDDGIDYVDAVNQKGEKISKTNLDIVGFEVIP